MSNGGQQVSSLASVALTICICLGPVSLAIYLPLVPLIRTEFGIDLQSAQLGLTLPFLAVLATPLLSGLLVDRIGRRRILLSGMMISMCGAILAAVTTSYDWFLVGRVTLGLFSSIGLVVARVVISDLHEGSTLTRKLAVYSIAPLIAVIGAPIVGALLTEFLQWRSVFWLLSITSAVAAIIIMSAMPETIRKSANADQVNMALLVSSRALWGYTLQSALHFGMAIGFCAVAAHVMVDALHRPLFEYALGLLLLCCALGAGVAIAGRVGTRYENRSWVTAICMLGVLVAGGSYGSISYFEWPLNRATLFVPGILLAFAAGLALPSSQAGILLALPGQAGGAMGLATAMQMLSAAGFTHLFTAQIASGLATLGICMVLAASAALLACWLMFNVEPARQQQP